MSTIDPSVIRTDIPKQGSGDPGAPVNELTADHRNQNTNIQNQFQNARNDVESLEALDVLSAKGQLLSRDANAYVAVPPAVDGHLVSYDAAQPSGIGSTDPATVGTTDHAVLSNRDIADQHPIGAVTGLQTALDAKAPLSHVGAGGAEHPEAGASAGFMSAADKTKLDGIPADATGDHTALSNRDAVDQHPIGAVTDLQMELDARMKTSVYDTTADGVVDGAESVALVLTNAIGAPLAQGELIRFDSIGNIIARANGLTGDWAHGITSEAIGTGATGRVVSYGLAPATTTGLAVDDVVYLGDNGAITVNPTLYERQRQRVGVVLAVGAPGWIYVASDIDTVDPDAALGVLALTDVADSYTHVQSSSVAWEELIPGPGDVVVAQAQNMVLGANAGRLAFDFATAQQPPDPATIAGTVSISASIEFPSANDSAAVAIALNGSLLTADARSVAQIGGNQTTGTAIPVAVAIPVSGLSDGDELSIVMRADAGTYIIHAHTVTFVSQGGGTGGGGGGGTNDHQALINRGVPGAHPATAVNVTPTGGISEADTQGALAGLDTRKADKTTGAVDGNLAGLVSNNLVDSGVDPTEVPLLSAENDFTAAQTMSAVGEALKLTGATEARLRLVSTQPRIVVEETASPNPNEHALVLVVSPGEAEWYVANDDAGYSKRVGVYTVSLVDGQVDFVLAPRVGATTLIGYTGGLTPGNLSEFTVGNRLVDAGVATVAVLRNDAVNVVDAPVESGVLTLDSGTLGGTWTPRLSNTADRNLVAITGATAVTVALPTETGTWIAAIDDGVNIAFNASWDVAGNEGSTNRILMLAYLGGSRYRARWAN